MGKVVVLTFQGDFEQQGFHITAQIGDTVTFSTMGSRGHLPPDPLLLERFQHWQYCYFQVTQFPRIQPKFEKPTNFSIREAEIALRLQFQTWINADSFGAVREKLRHQLAPTDTIRLLLTTDNMQLRQLPWHLWNFFEDYPHAELALSPLEYGQVRQQCPTPAGKVRILVILGHGDGIDIDIDRQVLETLPDTKLVVLKQPQRQELNDRLWDRQGWDILFFAGHSKTEAGVGWIYLNARERLTIAQLKHGLNQAIQQGLQFAIFNSCDGLGLAQQLASLQTPQLVVMREPVPDPIAQKFLEDFLQTFAAGQSFYLAVREAREKLQGLESQFPSASWLPVICQNPAATPPTWEELRTSTSSPTGQATPSRRRSHLRTVFVISAVVTVLVMVVRFLGWLQPSELFAYDHLMQQRPAEAKTIDPPRILVVEITDKDIIKYGYPLSDAILVQLIEKLEQYKPQAIGLDLHRYKARNIGGTDLIDLLKQHSNLFTVCAYGRDDLNYYDPPSKFSGAQIRDRVGFSNLLLDDNDIVRRQLLSYDPALSPPTTYNSRCLTPYSFSFQLAFHFLNQAGIDPLKVNDEDKWQFGQVVFHDLPARFGGYQQLDGQSSQIAINYRSGQPGQQFTLEEVLTDGVELPLKDRIVLIGVTAKIGRDFFETPIGKQAGVWVHAHMLSQLLSAVQGKHKRPLIWVLPQWGSLQWGDALWVFVWSLGGGLLAWSLRSPLFLGLAVGVTSFALYYLCLLLLIQGGWMPLIPTLLAFMVAAVVVTFDNATAIARRQERSQNFSSKESSVPAFSNNFQFKSSNRQRF